jgi:hypothetical protein
MDIMADEKTANERMKICKSCEHFLKTTQQCGICRCFMVFKTKIKNADCPEKKW